MRYVFHCWYNRDVNESIYSTTSVKTANIFFYRKFAYLCPGEFTYYRT